VIRGEDMFRHWSLFIRGIIVVCLRNKCVVCLSALNGFTHKWTIIRHEKKEQVLFLRPPTPINAALADRSRALSGVTFAFQRSLKALKSSLWPPTDVYKHLGVDLLTPDVPEPRP
jgi:hypothetical protein